jgi:hypothetical protein
MPAAWTDVCNDASIGAKLKKSDPKVSEVSGALVEEFSEIALNLTDHLGVDCNTKLPNSFKSDRGAWQQHIAKSIIEKRSLLAPSQFRMRPTIYCLKLTLQKIALL